MQKQPQALPAKSSFDLAVPQMVSLLLASRCRLLVASGQRLSPGGWAQEEEGNHSCRRSEPVETPWRYPHTHPPPDDMAQIYCRGADLLRAFPAASLDRLHQRDQRRVVGGVLSHALLDKQMIFADRHLRRVTQRESLAVAQEPAVGIGFRTPLQPAFAQPLQASRDFFLPLRCRFSFFNSTLRFSAACSPPNSSSTRIAP